MGLTGVLLVIFVTLKLLKVAPVVHWSWLWVLSPFWIPAALAIALIVLFVSFKVGAECLATVGDWFSRRRKMRDLMKD